MRIISFAILLILSPLCGTAQPTTEREPCRLGLTLSGGAARGFAHIGVLRAFEEAGIEIDYISGSSMGALIGLFYAAGKTPDEMIEIAKSINKRKLKTMSPLQFGKTGLDYVEQIIKNHVAQTTFEELKKPLFVCVTNFQSGRFEIISKGEFLPAVLASAAIPIKFEQQIINETPYIDGGVVNNLPVEPLRERCHVVVGISVNPVEIKTGKMNLGQKVKRVAELMINENEARRIEMCDYHLEIQGLGEIDFEDYDRVHEIHDLGYRAAKEFIAKNPGLVR
jgi:NTE family protein